MFLSASSTKAEAEAIVPAFASMFLSSIFHSSSRAGTFGRDPVFRATDPLLQSVDVFSRRKALSV